MAKKNKELMEQLETIASRLPQINSGTQCSWKIRGSEYKKLTGIKEDADNEEIKDDDWYDYTFYKPVNHVRRMMKAYKEGEWNRVLEYTNGVMKKYHELKNKKDA